MFGDNMKLSKYQKKLNKLNLKLNKLNSLKNKDYLTENKIKSLEDKINYYNEIIELYENLSDSQSLKKEVALKKEKYKRHKILYGNIFSTILMVCIPLALYSFFNAFYSIADSVMCAHISAQSVNDVAALAQVKNAINAFGLGLGGGGGVLVARYYGAGRMDDAKKSAANMLFIGVVMSLLIIVILVPVSTIIVSVVASNSKGVSLYFSLQTFELAIICINTMWIALEKVKGNGKKILLLNLVVLAIKMSLNAIYIYAIPIPNSEKNIVWIEISSIIAQSFLCAIAIKTLFSSKNALKITFKNMKPLAIYIKPILKLAIPVFLGKFVMNMGKLAVNIMAGQFYKGVTNGLIVGALAVSNNICGLVTGPTNSFEEGESSIVSQNIGNKNPKRTLQVFVKSSIVIMSISLVGYVLVRFIFMDELVNLFQSTEEVNPVNNSYLSNLIKEVLIWDSLSIPSLGVTACVLGLLYGYGKTFLSSMLNFSRIGTRILSLWILYASGTGYKAVGLAMGISNVVIMLLALGCLLLFLFNFKKESKLAMEKIDLKRKQ